MFVFYMTCTFNASELFFHLNETLDTPMHLIFGGVYMFFRAL